MGGLNCGKVAWETHRLWCLLGSKKLRTLWRLSGGYEILDVHHGYFQVKFDLEEDKEKVISGAP